MASQSSSLVRPRTIMQEPNQTKKPDKRSILVLTLCGACLFLFIICSALIAALVLVGKNLSSQAYQAKYTFNDTGIRIQSENTSNQLKVISSTMTTPKLSKVLDQIRWRLPNEIRPTLYNILLHPNFKTKTFSGNVSISLQITKPVSYIAVHSKKLIITQTLLERSLSSAVGDNVKSEKIPIFQAFEYPEYEYWVTEIEKPLDVGDYILALTFNGSLTDRIVGFYQSFYYDKLKNSTRLMATSKFEPTYARQAFPCFDEPSMKAKFKISLVKPLDDEYIALSNMNEETSFNDLNTQTTTVQFAESVPMSTYLSCFIVSDFKHKEILVDAKGIGENFYLRVFATRAQLNKVDFALETGLKITEHYINYFKIKYPLPKLDLAAIPDFVSGAMEHWGLVTFRETGLLYDEQISSTVNKQRVASTIAHELAHMWFGNLVTMAWWNELWLNEGFASYIQYKGTEAAYPEWKTTDQFLISDLHGVLSLDASLAAHPIVQPADNPDQITELFDTITYSKGASIIRMLEDFVGADKFRESVTNYLNAHAYGNAVTEDLLNEIDNLDLGFDAKYIMSTWTKQSGYPVVKVEPISKTEYKLTQKRFLSNPDDENAKQTPSEFNYRWYIPITYITDKQTTLNRIWFKNEDIEIIITVPEDHTWIKLNKDQVGYYRVNYPKEMWGKLATTLRDEPNIFSVTDRAHLLNDVFSLAEATQLNYNVALDLTKYLPQENDYVPWDVAASKIGGLKSYLYVTEYYPSLKKYTHVMINSVYETVGWSVDEDHLKNLLRTTILNLACSMELKECIDKVGERFDAWLDNPDQRPEPDLRNIIYYHGMSNVGNAEKWDKMWKLFLQESDAQEKMKLMYGLAAIKVHWILQKFIDLAWDENHVRGQDYFTCLTYISGNKIGESIVWDYVRENWSKLVDRFGLNERYLGRMIPSITSGFNTHIKLQEVQDFFARYPEAGAGAAARIQTVEAIKSRIKWLENNKNNVGTWLNENYT